MKSPEKAHSETSSPVKKKSKKAALSSLITPKPKATAPPASKEKPGDKVEGEGNPNQSTTSKKPKAKADPPASSPAEKESYANKVSFDDSASKKKSCLKEGKYSGSGGKSDKPAAKKSPPKPHDHKFKRTVVEATIDFSKPGLSQLESNGKTIEFCVVGFDEESGDGRQEGGDQS
jgi:hypothetical protein